MTWFTLQSGKPSMDLFGAIFGNTDSEDSSEEEEEKQTEEATPKSAVPATVQQSGMA